MSAFDYVSEHPWWALIYLLVIFDGVGHIAFCRCRRKEEADE